MPVHAAESASADTVSAEGLATPKKVYEILKSQGFHERFRDFTKDFHAHIYADSIDMGVNGQKY